MKCKTGDVYVRSGSHEGYGYVKSLESEFGCMGTAGCDTTM